MPEMIGIREFAQMTGYNEEYCRQLCRQNKAPRHFRFGRKIVFKREDVEEWLNARLVTPGTSQAGDGR